MGKCDWEGHKQNMTEANRAKGPENVRRKDRSSIIRQAVLALLLCSVAALVACTPVKEPERKERPSCSSGITGTGKNPGSVWQN